MQPATARPSGASSCTETSDSASSSSSGSGSYSATSQDYLEYYRNWRKRPVPVLWEQKDMISQKRGVQERWYKDPIAMYDHVESRFRVPKSKVNDKKRKQVEAEHFKECTFVPRVRPVADSKENAAAADSADAERKKAATGEWVKRVYTENVSEYWEKEVRNEQLRQQLEQERAERELEPCTFSPFYTGPVQLPEQQLNRVFGRLHGEASKKQKSKEQAQEERLQRANENCTFHPCITSQSPAAISEQQRRRTFQRLHGEATAREKRLHQMQQASRRQEDEALRMARATRYANYKALDALHRGDTSTSESVGRVHSARRHSSMRYS